MAWRKVADGHGSSWLFGLRNGASAVGKAFLRPFLQDRKVSSNRFEKLSLDVVNRFRRIALGRHESLVCPGTPSLLTPAARNDSRHDHLDQRPRRSRDGCAWNRSHYDAASVCSCSNAAYASRTRSRTRSCEAAS